MESDGNKSINKGKKGLSTYNGDRKNKATNYTMKLEGKNTC